jgi:predicted AlkP superfamily phosphohydrolase/phosphomutase
LLIGFDCADADLVEQWSSQGHLPTCAALRRQGVWGRLRSTSEVMHVAAWPTLYTGTSPGVHGLSHAYQVRAGEQEIRLLDPYRCAKPPFWSHLDAAGRKCIVMDAFVNARLDGFSGIQILEYGTWTWFGEPCSTPSRLLREIKRRFGPYPAPEHSQLVQVPRDLLGYRDQLIAGARLKSEVMRSLLRENEWDMAFISFAEAHSGGHYLWHTGDPDSPMHCQENMRGFGHPLREVYSAVDAAIGDLLSAVDDNTTVIIVSVDGMGPNCSASHYMPEMLHRMGLFYSNTVGSNESINDNALPSKSVLRLIREAIPMPMRQVLNRCLPRRAQYWRQLKWLNSGVDWQRSKAFCIPSSDEAYFRVNLAGREPLGNVNPGDEYEDLLASIDAELRDLLNPQNQHRVTDEVYLVDSVYPGPKRAELPDVVAKWRQDAAVRSEISSTRLGSIQMCAGHEVPPFYTGNHRNVAFVLARGPQLPEKAQLDGGHIIDVAPTILTELGVDLPPDFEGCAWDLRAALPNGT